MSEIRTNKIFQEKEKFLATLKGVEHSVKEVTAKCDMILADGKIVHKNVDTVVQNVFTLRFDLGASYKPEFIRLYFIAGMLLENGESKILPINEINADKVNFMLAQQPGLLEKRDGHCYVPDMPSDMAQVGSFLLENINEVEFRVESIIKKAIDEKVDGKIVHKEFTFKNFMPINPAE